MTWTENWTAGPSVVGTACARGVGQGPEIVCTLVGLTTTLVLHSWPSHSRRAKRAWALPERREAHWCSSNTECVLDPALAAGLCPKGTQGFRGKTHSTQIIQVSEGSVSSAPTKTLLMTSRAFACRVFISLLSFGKPSFPHSCLL